MCQTVKEVIKNLQAKNLEDFRKYKKIFFDMWDTPIVSYDFAVMANAPVREVLVDNLDKYIIIKLSVDKYIIENW